RCLEGEQGAKYDGYHMKQELVSVVHCGKATR
ncbi:unnamed protein product, partial [marine sediment metagenome]